MQNARKLYCCVVLCVKVVVAVVAGVLYEFVTNVLLVVFVVVLL